MSLEGEEPWDGQVTLAPSTPRPLDGPAPSSSQGNEARGPGLQPAGPKPMERMEKPQRGCEPGTGSHGASGRPPLLPCYSRPSGGCPPLPLPTSKSARDLVTCVETRPSLCVCLLSSNLGCVHKQASPRRLGGSPHPLRPRGPTCRCTRVAVPTSTLPEMPPT